LFKNKDGAFLRMILGALVKDYFAPRQIVVDIGDPEEMFVVAKGEISIFDTTDAALGRLTAGNAYAESALFYTIKTSRFKLTADTHCEVWALHQADFKEALKLHFSKLKYATIMTTNRMAQAIGRTNTMSSDMAAAAQKFKVNEYKATNKLARKLSTDQTKSVASSKTQSSWRKPNSSFQRAWKHTKCALLIMQLYEVPYYIAYQRGFGITNPADMPTMGAIPRTIQELDFIVSALVEIFFYADWLFRARFFYRFVVAGDAADSSASFGLLTQSSMIFRHYRENENTALDIIQNLPLPLVWDILSKKAFSTGTIDLARFIRLLRLVRLHELQALLRSLMIEHALSPSKRQLVYVVIFVTSSAHIAACLFFLLGDMPSFRGGLPIDGILPDSTTAFDCLRDATLFQNCTWYMYDRSTYNIDSPFLRALQWSVVLQSTVGFGEIMSFSTRESLLGCVWIFLGANICYCIGCVLSSILGQLSIHSTIRNERMEEINLALQSTSNITEATKVMIRSYYDTKWEMNGCAKRDHDILENLPRSLRYGVCEALYLEDLRSCFLFEDDVAESWPSVFLRALARLTRSEIFLKNVMVVREGHLATDFYVIQRGEVELLLPPLLLACPSPRGGDQPKPRVIRQASANGKLSWDDQGSLAIVPRANDSRLSLSRRSARESMASSVFYSRGMKLSSLDLRLLALRRRQTVQDTPLLSPLIPISILQRHDSFGEESITPLGSARSYQANVRVVATAHLAVIHRKDLVALADRFPDEIERIYALVRAKAARDNELLKSLRQNFMCRDKIARRLGIPKSLYVSRKRRLSTADTGHRWRRLFRVIDPEKAFARWWYRAVSSILVYNFYSVIFRVAFLPTPSDGTMLMLTVVDYMCDLVLYIDIVLKFGSLGYVERGEKVMNRSSIRQRYVGSWLKQDCWSMLPAFYVGDYFLMTLCRLPRLLRSPQLLLILDDVHAQILEHFLRGNNTMLSSVFDLFRFVLIFVSTAHYVGSLYYLLGRLQLDWGVAERSWVNVDFILLQYPDNVWVHYMRTLYWCLSTVGLLSPVCPDRELVLTACLILSSLPSTALVTSSREMSLRHSTRCRPASWGGSLSAKSSVASTCS
jgi:CRP-like cAMP-binding protein